jgi:hypothetical protein
MCRLVYDRCKAKCSRGHTRTRTHTHARTHILARLHPCIHTRAVPPHTPPRHIEDRPSASAALRAPAETAHTLENDVTQAVFHAPMFALKAVADRNACKPTARRQQRREVLIHSVWMRVRPHTHVRARTHARMDAHTRARMWCTSASVIRSHAKMCV